MANSTEEDMEFHSFVGYEWDNGVLILEIMLQSGKTYKAPFTLIKKDRPIELARYIRKEVVETRRGGWYKKWAKSVLKDANRTIRRLHRMYRTDRIERLASIKTINVRRLSRNKRMQKKDTRIKFGITVPNSVKEALELDRKNKNNLWADAIIKELKALEKANVFAFYPPNYKFGIKI